MAIIGRRACPWCGFGGAHVKRNDGKLPYHHCPNCGTMTAAKNGHQAELLQRGMRSIDGGTVPEPPETDDPIIFRSPTPPGPSPSAPAAAALPSLPSMPPPPRRPAGLWDQLMRAAS